MSIDEPVTAGLPTPDELEPRHRWRPASASRDVELGVIMPSRDDPVVGAASEAAGGIAGRRVRPGTARRWSPVAVLLVLAGIVFGLGLVQHAPCRTDNWSTDANYVAMCYSDVPILYWARGLGDGAVPYLNNKGSEDVEYPVLTGAAMYVVAQVIGHDNSDNLRSVRFYDATALLLLVCLLLVVWLSSRTQRSRPWDAAWIALAPGIALVGTLNWDLIAIAFTSGAMLAWSRRYPALAGVLLGLGAATKLYPIFLLGPLLLLCWRAGRMREFSRSLIGAVAAWLVVNVPIMIANWDGWVRFYSLSRSRGVDLGSPYLALQYLTTFAQTQGHLWFNVTLSTDSVNIIGTGLFVVLCAGIALLALLAPRRPRLPSLAFLVVAAFLLTNKVYSPQYVLWLIPLAALAHPRARDLMIWWTGELIYFVCCWQWLQRNNDDARALNDQMYAISIFIRMALEIYLVVMVVRGILAERYDPVRTPVKDSWAPFSDENSQMPDWDDPAGGVLDGAPDVVRQRPSAQPEPVPIATG